MAIDATAKNPERLGFSIGNKKPHVMGLIARPPHLSHRILGQVLHTEPVRCGGRLVEEHSRDVPRTFNVSYHNCEVGQCVKFRQVAGNSLPISILRARRKASVGYRESPRVSVYREGPTGLLDVVEGGIKEAFNRRLIMP